MISLNEGHNLTQVLDNLKGWANEVFLIDSYSQDNTVDIALHYGVHVVQRKFNGFGDQWNFALSSMPISSPWTMKMDPDEILTDELKKNIQESINASKADAFCFDRRLWFMGRQLPIKQNILRIWKTGSIDKQNRYTSAEAILSCTKSPLADKPILFGTSFQRRMWLKANFNLIPGRYFLLFIFYYLFKCAFIAGKVGFIWSKLRSDVMRYIEYKKIEIEITGKIPSKRYYGPGLPDLRVLQND